MANEQHKRRGGRPTTPANKQKKVLTERLEVKLSPEMKEFVLERGGASLIRWLIANYQSNMAAAQEEEETR